MFFIYKKVRFLVVSEVFEEDFEGWIMKNGCVGLN